jgi:hypothetical protein
LHCQLRIPTKQHCSNAACCCCHLANAAAHPSIVTVCAKHVPSHFTTSLFLLLLLLLPPTLLLCCCFCQLDILAGVKVAGKARGAVLLNGQPRRSAAFASLASYVQQKDVLVPSATVSSSSSNSHYYMQQLDL